MKVVLLLFCPSQPLKSAPRQEGRWLCQARLAPALEPGPMSKGFPSGQELTAHSGNDDTSRALCCEPLDSGNQKPFCLPPSVTFFGFTVGPWVVFPADSESAGVILPEAEITAQMPCLQKRIPRHGGKLAQSRLHPSQQTPSASKMGQDSVVVGKNVFGFLFCCHSSVRLWKAEYTGSTVPFFPLWYWC